VSNASHHDVPVASPSPQVALLDQAQGAAAAGDFATAVVLLERLLEEVPGSGVAHAHLGAACLALGREEEAQDNFRLALAFDPACIDARLGLGRLLETGEGREAALGIYREGLEYAPRSPELLCNAGLIEFHLGDVQEALRLTEAAIAERPAMAEAWHNAGYIRLHLGETGTASNALRRALEIAPDSLTSLACLGHALRDQKRFDEARACYQRVLDRDPGCVDARANLGFLELLTGNFAQGWRHYEWRFGPPRDSVRGFGFPRWRGEPLAGRRILIHAEQGLGDEVMFASCVPDVLATAGGVVLECSERLAGLFARSFPGATVHGGRKSDSLTWVPDLLPIDYQCPIGSLPQLLRRDRSEFGTGAPYLLADPALVQHFRSRLHAAPARTTVGIAWRGGDLLSKSLVRSMPVQALAPLLGQSGYRFVSLQHGALDAGEREALDRAGVERDHFDPADIEQLAAIISVLDAVVSVDNLDVHLAGALGRPVIALLPWCPEWRYGVEGETMPWYGSATLFRQTAPGDWGTAVETAIERLSLGRLRT